MSEFAGLSGVYGADPEAVIGVAAHVAREWSYGVRIVELVGLPNGGAIAACRHGDGSRWFVATDRYACDLVNADTCEQVCEALRSAGAERERVRIATMIAEEEEALAWLAGAPDYLDRASVADQVVAAGGYDNAWPIK